MKKPLIIIVAVALIAVGAKYYIDSRQAPSLNAPAKVVPAATGAAADRPAGAEADATAGTTGETSVAAAAPAAAANPAPPKPLKPEKPHAAAKVDVKNAKRGVVKGNGVNVRTESRITQDNSIGKANKGDEFEVIGAEQPAGDNHVWIKVRLKNGKTGFIRDDLVELAQ